MNVINIITLVCILDLIFLFLILIKLLKLKKIIKKIENVWVEDLKIDPNITKEYIGGFIDGLKQVNRFYD